MYAMMLEKAGQPLKYVHTLTKPGDTAAQSFAKKMGACWAGNAGDIPSDLLDTAIIFAPVGEFAPIALRAVAKGGKH